MKKDENLFTPIVPEIKLFVKSLIARDLWNMNELYRISNEENKILKAAVKALNDGRTGGLSSNGTLLDKLKKLKTKS